MYRLVKRLLASRGASLSLADLNEAALRKVITTLPGSVPRHLGVAVDVRDPASVEAWIDKRVEKFGKLDGAVNMAGVLCPSHTSILETTVKDLNFVMSVNVNGVFNCLKSQIKALEKGGAIVSAASISGQVGLSNSSIYCASKAAVISLSTAAAKENGHLRINYVAPGVVYTPMSADHDPKRVGNRLMANAQRKMGNAHELATVIWFLLSQDASFVTGAVYNIDGGWITSGGFLTPVAGLLVANLPPPLPFRNGLPLALVVQQVLDEAAEEREELEAMTRVTTEYDQRGGPRVQSNFAVAHAAGRATSSGKVILVLALFFFTFIAMDGGNPQGDTYGFRNWNHPGAFALTISFRKNGPPDLWVVLRVFSLPSGLLHFALSAQSRSIPESTLKAAYKTIYIRFFLFFIGSAIAVGIELPSNDKTLPEILIGNGSGGGTAAASPYVIAMNNMGVSDPRAGEQELHLLALDGRAPAFFKTCTKQGVPIYAHALTMAFACLGFLQQSKQGAQVLSILVNLVTGGAFINYLVMPITYVFYHRATKVQGIDRKSLPYYGWGQPYCGCAASVLFTIVIGTFRYTSFSPFNVEAFFGCYTMTTLSIVLYIF
ncbi:amino acid transporter [Fusarium austroafricanum]|uniref:Amino acid transporter n=1 Tax=Fusarium austroafricanum TaxID=2364996 RepID=A0A8H4KF05_9HYPO|nr:amino acid transporter [Fusarium austroafricanum]